VGAAVLALAILAGTLAMGMPAAGAAEAHGTRCVGVRHAHWQAQVCAWVRLDCDRLGNTQVQGAGSIRHHSAWPQAVRVRSTVVLVSMGGPHMANRRTATTRVLVTRTSGRVWVDGSRVRACHGVRVWWPDGTSRAYLLRSGPVAG
jgi:hypothetical protein